jgi:hypothetical protein
VSRTLFPLVFLDDNCTTVPFVPVPLNLETPSGLSYWNLEPVKEALPPLLKVLTQSGISKSFR